MASKLKITFISVGNGDSIFIDYQESDKSDSLKFCGLIDCNDSVKLKSTQIFLKRYFEMGKRARPKDGNFLDFVMLSHIHADHINGLQDIIKTFGARIICLSEYIDLGGHAPLITFLNDIKDKGVANIIKVRRNLPPIEVSKDLFLSFILPLDKLNRDSNENNNSIIMVISHFEKHFVFSGDAEYKVWNDQTVIKRLKSLNGIQVFKVPHHGAVNGTIDPAVEQEATWFTTIPSTTYSVISSHIERYGHPHQKVLDKLVNTTVLNTATTQDQNIEFTSDGEKEVTVKYFR